MICEARAWCAVATRAGALIGGVVAFLLATLVLATALEQTEDRWVR
jgi:hypothetical protein